MTVNTATSFLYFLQVPAEVQKLTASFLSDSDTASLIQTNHEVQQRISKIPSYVAQKTLKYAAFLESTKEDRKYIYKTIQEKLGYHGERKCHLFLSAAGGVILLTAAVCLPIFVGPIATTAVLWGMLIFMSCVLGIIAPIAIGCTIGNYYSENTIDFHYILGHAKVGTLKNTFFGKMLEKENREIEYKIAMPLFRYSEHYLKHGIENQNIRAIFQEVFSWKFEPDPPQPRNHYPRRLRYHRPPPRLRLR